MLNKACCEQCCLSGEFHNGGASGGKCRGKRADQQDGRCIPGDDKAGDARRFGRADALDEQWRIVDDVLEHHDHIHLYASGSMGPTEADALAADLGGWVDPEPG